MKSRRPAQRTQAGGVTSKGARGPTSGQPSGFNLDSLAGLYGLQDMMPSSRRVNLEDQTVEQEYQSYVNAPVSPLGTNTLKHWEVCN
jgi:hypothetical protein